MTLLTPYRDWLETHDLRFPDEATQQQLSGYLAGLQTWGKRMNLTADRDPSRLLERHLLDSLMMMRLEREMVDGVLDIGSGGGFPAIPLAIMLPHVRFLLMERVARKCAFLKAMGRELGLSNISVVESDLDVVRPPLDAGVAITRAVRVDARLFHNLSRLGVPRLLGFSSEHSSYTILSYRLPGERADRYLTMRPVC